MSASTPRGSEPAKTTMSAPAREVEQLVAEELDLRVGDRRPALVDLGRLAVRRVVDGHVRARLLADAHEVVEDRLLGELLDDAGAGRPPANPVAITGWPSIFSARAMFTPLPPAIVVWSTVRWRRPSRKLGTDSDLSIAALRVTVMIMRSRSARPGLSVRRVERRRITTRQRLPSATPRAGEASSGTPDEVGEPVGDARLGDRRRGDQRHPRDDLAALADHQGARPGRRAAAGRRAPRARPSPGRRRSPLRDVRTTSRAATTATVLVAVAQRQPGDGRRCPGGPPPGARTGRRP